jgi:hypothetical protein
MSTLLFSNIPSRDEEVLKSAKFTKIALPLMCIFMALLCISGLYEEQFDIETAIVFLLCPILFMLFLALPFLAAVRIKWQCLLVYNDKILLRQVWSTKEQKFDLAPSDYKIKVKIYYHRGGATVHLIFIDKNNRRLFRYTTDYTTHLSKWLKYELKNIGCEIIPPKNGY